MKQCQEWLKDARKDNSKVHLTTLKKLVTEAQQLLQALDPSTPLVVPEDEEEKQQKILQQEQEKQRWIIALSAQEFFPTYPLALCVKALEINKDVLDTSVNWLIEQGETYLFDHSELFDMQNPLEAENELALIWEKEKAIQDTKSTQETKSTAEETKSTSQETKSTAEETKSTAQETKTEVDKENPKT